MYVTSILDRALRERRRRLAGEHAEMRRRVQRALLELRDRFGVRSAYIVGSLRSPDRWRECSDVDVAVAGCSHAVLDVMKATEGATGRAVDVIALDRHPFPEIFIRSGIESGDGSRHSRPHLVPAGVRHGDADLAFRPPMTACTQCPHPIGGRYRRDSLSFLHGGRL